MSRPNEHFVRHVRPFLSGERETYATVLLAILLQVYGADVLDWDPLTVEAQVVEDFGVHMPQVVYDQLMALINVLTNDSVYRLVPVFDQTVNALTRCSTSTEQDIPSAEEVAWTIFEITANDPDPYGQGRDGDMPWGHDIALYCGVVLADEGIRHPPTTLSFAVMPRWMPTGMSSDPTEFAAAFGAQQDAAGSIDQFVEKNFTTLVAHLREVGLEPAPPLLEASRRLPEESPLDRLLPG